MKNLKIVLIFALFVLSLYCQSTAPSYDQYLVTYNKTYSAAQKTQRQAIYNNRTSLLTSLSTTYNITATVNNFTDWTDAQLLTLRGYKSKSGASEKTPYVNYPNAPSALDWRSKSSVTNVQYQNQCGSDWAFAAIAYAQSKLIIDGKQDSNINLSQQKVLQCTSGSSCSGGYLEDAMSTIVSDVQYQSLYSYSPFQSKVGICTIPGFWVGSTVQNYYNLTDDQLIQLLQERPIAVAVSSAGWQSYSTGVFTCNNNAAIDHAVLLIGYNPNYWIIKNSWGAGWGENGYMKISRSALLNCKIGSVAVRTYQWHLVSAIFMVILAYFMM